MLPRVADPGYAAALLDICAQEGIQALFPGLDPELEPLSRLSDALRALGCELICSAPAAIRLLRNKLACSEFFTPLDLPFAPTLPLARVEEVLDLGGFPIVVKPLGGSASRGVHVVFSRAELDKLSADGTLGAEVAYIVQPFLVPVGLGKRRNQLRREDVYANHALVQDDECTVQVIVDRDGAPLGHMTCRSLLKDGAVIRMRPCQPDLAGVTGKALKMAGHLAGLGLLGPCNFQSRLTPDGPVFYEINPRCSGGTGGRAMLGFNEVEACLRRLALGSSLEEARACLKPRFDQVCAWHPAELLMAAGDIETLRQGGAVQPRG